MNSTQNLYQHKLKKIEHLVSGMPGIKTAFELFDDDIVDLSTGTSL